MRNNELSDEELLEPAGKRKEKKQSFLMTILNGDFLAKDFFLSNLPFLLFLFFLLFLLVAKGYYYKGLVKDIRDTRLELDQNTSDYIENKTRFDQETQRYKMLEYLKDKNLKEAESAIKVIKSDKIK